MQISHLPQTHGTYTIAANGEVESYTSANPYKHAWSQRKKLQENEHPNDVLQAAFNASPESVVAAAQEPQQTAQEKPAPVYSNLSATERTISRSDAQKALRWGFPTVAAYKEAASLKAAVAKAKREGLDTLDGLRAQSREAESRKVPAAERAGRTLADLADWAGNEPNMKYDPERNEFIPA